MSGGHHRMFPRHGVRCIEHRRDVRPRGVAQATTGERPPPRRWPRCTGACWLAARMRRRVLVTGSTTASGEPRRKRSSTADMTSWSTPAAPNGWPRSAASPTGCAGRRRRPGHGERGAQHRRSGERAGPVRRRDPQRRGLRRAARVTTDDGHARVLAVNVLAPYVLTVLIERPERLIYLSSGMHHGGHASVADLDWRRRPWDAVQAYSDSKLLVTTLSAALARRWPDVHTNAVDPGWVPTRMGGPSAPTTSHKATPPRCGSPSATDPRPESPGTTGTTGTSRPPPRPSTTPRSRTPCSPSSVGSPG